MSLTSKTTKGVFWSGSSQVLKQIFQLIITAILARLLSPSDFGTLGMATVFISFITIFNEMGISAAIVQKKDMKHEHLSSIFFINIGMGLLLTALTIFVSPLIASFYQKDALKKIVIFLSFNFLFGSFAIIQQALLLKSFEFKKLMLADVVSLILSGFIGIFLAYSGFGVWSLVIQSLANTLFRVISLWIVSSFRPKFLFDWNGVKNYFLFSFNVLGSNIINYFARNLDYLLIGKFLGPAQLGYYTLAYKLMLYPLKNITSVIAGVFFPAFSAIQDNKPKIKEAYLKGIQYIALLTFPLMLGLFAIAPEFIMVVYGKKWGPAIFVIRVLCFTGMCQSIGTTVGTIFLSCGRPDLQFKWSIFAVPLICIAIAIGLKWGINGVAVSYTAAELCLWLLSHVIANKLINLKMKDFLMSLIPITLISFSMLIIVSGFHYYFRSVLYFGKIDLMAGSIIIGIFCYFTLLKLFRIKLVDEIIKLIADQLTSGRIAKKDGVIS